MSALAAEIRIAGRRIGRGHPVYVIAELSANHLGSRDRAAEIVRAAAGAGADAIKLQTYTPDTITLDADGEPFRIGAGTPWEGRRLHEIYGEAHMPWDWQPGLAALAQDLGLDCFSSVFDATSVAFLEKMQVPAYKIASFELVDTGLIECAARTGKPLILSTGMATLDEVRRAIDAAVGAGARELALLKCSSAYPSPPEVLNLRAIELLQREFGVPVGLSDHSLANEVVVASVALGACIVERHLTLSRADGGADASFSLEPVELRQMVDSIRLCQAALGEATFGPTQAEEEVRRFRRSLFVVRDIAAGEVFCEENLRSIRPGDGLAPHHLPAVLGRRAAQAIAKGTPLRWELLE